jgi:hypothetical protein
MGCRGTLSQSRYWQSLVIPPQYPQEGVRGRIKSGCGFEAVTVCRNSVQLTSSLYVYYLQSDPPDLKISILYMVYVQIGRQDRGAVFREKAATLIVKITLIVSVGRYR